MSLEKIIIGYKSVIDIFGKWPSFHDAEIIACEFVREMPSLLMHLKVPLNYNSKFDMKICDNVIFVELSIRFAEIDDVIFQDFNHQNVIFGLDFEPQDNLKIKVIIKPCYGANGAFNCKAIEVVSVSNKLTI